eukprot:jgi/Chlat1/605/Chrsp103S01026
MTEAALRGGKNLRSVKELPILQDGPPPGGFPAVKYGRSIPNKGPHGVTLFTATAILMGYGLYRVGLCNRERRALQQEKLAARVSIMPYLQAEEDARYVEKRKRQIELEAEIMRNVPGWKVGENVYKTRSWMPPASFPTVV